MLVTSRTAPALRRGSPLRRLRPKRWLARAAMGWVLGCRAPTPESKAPTSAPASVLLGSPLELYSWWSSPAEVAARALLIERFQQETGAIVRNGSPPERAAAQEQLLARFAAGSPPDVTQASAGSRLQRWVEGSGLAANAGWLQPLGFLEARAARFPPAVWELISFSGQPYAVPLNIHRLNTLFYNVGTLAEAGLELPASEGALLASCQGLRERASQSESAAAGECIGFSATPWMAEAFFRNLLLAEAGGGPEAARWWSELAAGGNTALSTCSAEPDPVLGQAFLRLAELAPHFNADWAAAPAWDDLAARLGDGRLAFLPHPDWVHGALLSRGREPDRDYGVIPAPGTAGLFVFSMDTFALPAQARVNPAALAWLERLATARYQQDFNRIKGSVPALLGTDVSGFDSVMQVSHRDFSRPGAVLVPALQLITPNSGFVDALAAAVIQVAGLGDRQVAWQSLCAAYRPATAAAAP